MIFVWSLFNLNSYKEIKKITSKVFFYFYALNGLTTHFDWLTKFECKKFFLKRDMGKKKFVVK